MERVAVLATATPTPDRSDHPRRNRQSFGANPYDQLGGVVDAALSEMTPSEIKGTVAYMAANSNNVPNEIDGKSSHAVEPS